MMCGNRIRNYSIIVVLIVWGSLITLAHPGQLLYYCYIMLCKNQE